MNQLFVYMTHIPNHLHHKVETTPPNDVEASEKKKHKKTRVVDLWPIQSVVLRSTPFAFSNDWERGWLPNLILNDYLHVSSSPIHNFCKNIYAVCSVYIK